MHRQNRRAGFSIIELVIFLAALIVLVAIAAPRLIRSIERERAPTMIEMVDSLPATVQPGASESMAFRLVDTRGEPVPRRRVEVTSTTGDSIAPAQSLTDSTGVARFTLYVRGDSGLRELRVQVPGSTIEKQLSTTVRAPPRTDTPAPDPDTAAPSGQE